MRPGPFPTLRITRVAGFAAVALTILSLGIHFRHDAAWRAVSHSVAAPTTDPLARELARCQAISMAASDSTDCEAAWAENRRRFFTYRPADSAAASRRSDPKTVSKPVEQ